MKGFDNLRGGSSGANRYIHVVRGSIHYQVLMCGDLDLNIHPVLGLCIFLGLANFTYVVKIAKAGYFGYFLKPHH